MKRSKPLQRKTPMKRVGFRTDWQKWEQENSKLPWPITYREYLARKANPAPNTTKTRNPMAQRSTKRAKQERAYASSHTSFLAAHPVCPVTGERTVQIHHSAKREGRWLNLQRYWIAVSQEGHKWIEEHKEEAEKYSLMVRISETCSKHCDTLLKHGITDLFRPVFYITNISLPLVNESGRPIYAEE